MQTPVTVLRMCERLSNADSSLPFPGFDGNATVSLMHDITRTGMYGNIIQGWIQGLEGGG